MCDLNLDLKTILLKTIHLVAYLMKGLELNFNKYIDKIKLST